MRSLWLFIATLATLSVDAEQEPGPRRLMEKLQREYAAATRNDLVAQDGKCTAETIGVRKEWGSMSDKERTSYIDAVHCMRSLPPKISHKLVPGARNRWDDFAAAHINNTLLIHWTGRFLPWHRYFVHSLEKAMREECGYPGYQPYWDWSKYAFKPWQENPLIDGSRFSLSGDGKKVPHGPVTGQLPGGKPPRPVITRPPGLGGGCIEHGPFKDLTVTLGNVTTTKSGGVNISNGLESYPHCVVRDFLPELLRTANTYENVTDLILDHDTETGFQKRMEGFAPSGVHVGGHSYIGGEMANLYASPNDPLFFAHHAQVDRVWAIWQSRDFAKRTYQTGETITFLNYPPSRKFRLNDTLFLTEVFDTATAREMMSPTKGRLCYMYE